jgi:TrpR-related protein YerC/YecD
MAKKWANPQTNDLFKAILRLQDFNEARRFFRDLLTEEELIEFGKRWQAAQMLDQGLPYSRIEKVTGLSSTTVARISKWLNRGMGGYKLMLQRIPHHHNLSPFRKGLC